MWFQIGFYVVPMWFLLGFHTCGWLLHGFYVVSTWLSHFWERTTNGREEGVKSDVHHPLYDLCLGRHGFYRVFTGIPLSMFGQVLPPVYCVCTRDSLCEGVK